MIGAPVLATRSAIQCNVSLCSIDNIILVCLALLSMRCRMERATYSETFVLQPAYSGVGSIDPFGEAKCERRLVCTGWEPHGDSGSARSRVLASQPAR